MVTVVLTFAKDGYPLTITIEIIKAVSELVHQKECVTVWYG